MARDAAVLVTWTQPARGREAKSLEVFMEFLGFWQKRAADGKCAEPEAFFSSDGSNGFALVKGKSTDLNEILESEEYEHIVGKGQLIVDDLKTHMFFGGTDEEVMRVTRIFAESGQELGYM